MKIQTHELILLIGLTLCAAIYWPGLHGGYLFDDYPNIVDNTFMHVDHGDISDWVNAAMSSPASVFKRPLSMISFTANYWASGLDPFWMKLTNLLLHLLNGVLLFTFLQLLLTTWHRSHPKASTPVNIDLFAAMVSVSWLVAPINLSGVLYVVQRMEILAQSFVLVGLWCYLLGRRKQIEGHQIHGSTLIIVGIATGTLLGLAAKETAVLLPAYVFAIELCFLRFANNTGNVSKRLLTGLICLLIVPGLLGMAWLLPGIVSGSSFSGRDFTLAERLLTEPRVVVQYLHWILAPTPEILSFYHDDIPLSKGWFTPTSTFFSIALLTGLMTSAVITLRKAPLYSFGIFLFFISHSLTATIFPLELVFEHRNYFASLGIFISALAILLLLARNASQGLIISIFTLYLLFTSSVTLMRSIEWAHPLDFAYSEASRNPQSPRAQYELGRALVIASSYNPQSPLFTKARQAFTAGMNLPRSSILPELALISLDARSGTTAKQELWASIYGKLKQRPPRKEEITAVRAFLSCQIHGQCTASPKETVRMVLIVLSQRQDPYLLSDYAFYAAYVLNDQALAYRVARDVVNQLDGRKEIKEAMAPLLESTNSSSH